MNSWKSWGVLGRRALLGATLALSALACAGTKEEIQADMRAGRWESADKRLVETLAKHPGNALAHYWRAQTQLQLGHADSARSELQKAMELDPSERFSGDKGRLAQLKERLGLGNGGGAEVLSAPAEEARVQPAEPAPRVEPAATARPAVEVAPVREAKRSGGLGLGSMLLIAALIILPVGYLLFRKQRDVLRQDDREQWQGRIRETLGDLDNALRASDANQQLSPEAKLGNYDRVRQAKAELDNALGALPRTTDFEPVARIVERSQDLAADLRGEQRPSDRRREQEAAKLAYERDMRAREMEARTHQSYGQPVGAGGSSILPTVAAVAVGAALGSAMGQSHAGTRHSSRDDEDEMRRRDAEYDRMAGSGSGSSGLDLGGSGDSSSDWDSGGSSDTGGGGSDSFD